MPQLIAMVIVVVGAMIYMFQTFGGTGDKIEATAQKTSVLSEIQTIKEEMRYTKGLIKYTSATDYTTLKSLATEELFPDPVKKQLDDIADSSSLAVKNVYKAISTGAADNGLKLSLVPVTGAYPGVFVDMSGSQFDGKRGFLEKQLKTDLEPLYAINSKAKTALDDAGETVTDGLPVLTDEDGTETDGLFIVYFKDLDADLKVK